MMSDFVVVKDVSSKILRDNFSCALIKFDQLLQEGKSHVSVLRETLADECLGASGIDRYLNVVNEVKNKLFVVVVVVLLEHCYQAHNKVRSINQELL